MRTNAKLLLSLGCLLALLTWLQREAPEPQPSAEAAKRPPKDTEPKGSSKTHITLTLQRDPLQWSSLRCNSTTGGLSWRVQVENAGAVARWAEWAARWGQYKTPNGQWRGVLRGIGLSPDTLAHYGGEISPWVAYVGLKTEETWAQRDLWERWADIDAIPEEALTKEERRELRRSASRELEFAQNSLAEQLSTSDEPSIRSYAVAVASEDRSKMPSKADLLDSSLDELARLGIARRLCREPLELDESEREQLFQDIQSAEDGVWAVHAARIGLWSALDSGKIEETIRWVTLLEEAQSFCLSWGHHGRFASDPRLSSWEGLPSNARPGGFEEAVATLAAAIGSNVKETSCENVPCSAIMDEPFKTSNFTDLVEEIWGKESVGLSFFGHDLTYYAAIVALSPEWELSEYDRYALAEVASHNPWICPASGELSAIRAELAPFLPEDRELDWETSLRKAIFSCHQDAEEGHFRETVRADAYWNDGWVFFPGHPMLDCVAERARGPAPPPGMPIELLVQIKD